MRIDVLSAAAAGFTAGVVLPRLLALMRPLLGPAASSLQVAPPHPGWKPGDKQPPPWGDDPDAHHALDPKELTSAYPLMISAYAPRPIAFVSTLSAAGDGNLAPFSYSGVFNHDPCVIGFSVCRNRNSPDGKKDTLANIEETGEFVVNMMSDWFVEVTPPFPICSRARTIPPLPIGSRAHTISTEPRPSSFVRRPTTAAARSRAAPTSLTNLG
jgi:flavin reductase (DIM6/NTAB) family NADH-FMN oxidoreductase RutF